MHIPRYLYIMHEVAPFYPRSLHFVVCRKSTYSLSNESLYFPRLRISLSLKRVEEGDRASVAASAKESCCCRDRRGKLEFVPCRAIFFFPLFFFTLAYNRLVYTYEQLVFIFNYIICAEIFFFSKFPELICKSTEITRQNDLFLFSSIIFWQPIFYSEITLNSKCSSRHVFLNVDVYIARVKKWRITAFTKLRTCTFLISQISPTDCVIFGHILTYLIKRIDVMRRR